MNDSAGKAGELGVELLLLCCCCCGGGLDTGASVSSMLRITCGRGDGGGESMSSMLLTGARGGRLAVAVGAVSSSAISSMLLTGDLGVYGEADRTLSGEVPEVCPLLSSSASTSFLSMSSMASMLIGRAMVSVCCEV